LAPAAEQLTQHVNVGGAALLHGSGGHDCGLVDYHCRLSTPALVLSCLSVGLMIGFLLAWAFCIAYARAPSATPESDAAKLAALLTVEIWPTGQTRRLR
jgi:hypothetical protein